MKKKLNKICKDSSLKKQTEEQLNNQKGVVVWFTGLSGAGKTTIANELYQLLIEQKNHSYILDGDIFRAGLNSDLSFTKQDREENLRRTRYIAEMFCDAGIVTLVTFISPFKASRDKARSLLKNKYIEIYVKVSLKVAEARDPKGLYKKARSGELTNFTGLDSPYEEPLAPEVTLDTEKESASKCARRVFDYLVEANFISYDK
ncbi:adenylyl-sulfate kinase [Betaproteobacteria bacterium]|nr:adenylyl-sulfate kinase [Betaproteobacteria bacterium]